MTILDQINYSFCKNFNTFPLTLQINIILFFLSIKIVSILKVNKDLRLYETIVLGIMYYQIFSSNIFVTVSIITYNLVDRDLEHYYTVKNYKQML